MNKNIITIVIVLVVVLGGYLLFNNKFKTTPPTLLPPQDSEQKPSNQQIVPQLTISESSAPKLTLKPSASPAPAVKEKIVIYTNSGFSPASLLIKNGEEVIFKNQSSESMWPASAMHPTHRVYSETALDEHCPDRSSISFDACTGILPGSSWKFVFNKAGTWKYHDHLNPTNYGAIVVE